MYSSVIEVSGWWLHVQHSIPLSDAGNHHRAQNRCRVQYGFESTRCVCYFLVGNESEREARW